MKRTRTADSDYAPAIKTPQKRTKTLGGRSSDVNLESSPRIVQLMPPTSHTGSYPNTTSLHDLPAELLYEIQLFSLSATFPYTSRHIYAIFRSTTPHFRARYIIEATKLVIACNQFPSSWTPTITTWLRFGLCDLEVFKVLERTFNPLPSTLGSLVVRDVQLPKRLFKMLDGESGFSNEAKDGVVQLLRYLFTPRTLVYTGVAKRKNIDLENDNTAGGDVEKVRNAALKVAADSTSEQEQEATPYRCVVTLWPVNANSQDGYGLARAVYLQRMDVVDLLLANGAMPTMKDNLAIKIALGRRDFKLAKRLLRHVKQGHLSNGQELLSIVVKAGARDIVDLLKAHGVVPDMRTVRMLMRKR
ncbi:hypothetical protein FRB98_006916 [Tulasnella sp. 332]|nr:hypothetical protein FRB98_006916 [Tulasnella sp. 332]